MKRLLLLATALIAGFSFAVPAHAADETNAASVEPSIDPSLLTFTASMTNELLNSLPGLGGPDTRHLCLIFDKLDKSYCLYIPLP